MCINCGGPHQCNSETCRMIVDKTFELNKFVIDILLEEDIMNNKSEILRVPRAAIRQESLPFDADDKSFEQFVDKIISQRLNDMSMEMQNFR
ncbi:hypothetical protein BpHYR1_033751 [Brachionus plicatilis]|uniref:Uncharacterized protein n=1 Tax=Brachionus plicatilis TaxID=10195 RepID=A0A3M7T2I9_BRAPC|nr:hypothetical protein BpHYR1_033751 [Brachionus plicatilis]